MKAVKQTPKGIYVESWDVESESVPGKMYAVSMDRLGEWSCSCPRWTLNASRPTCKHIRYVWQYRVNTLPVGTPKATKTRKPKAPKPVSEFSFIEI